MKPTDASRSVPIVPSGPFEERKTQRQVITGSSVENRLACALYYRAKEDSVYAQNPQPIRLHPNRISGNFGYLGNHASSDPPVWQGVDSPFTTPTDQATTGSRLQNTLCRTLPRHRAIPFPTRPQPAGTPTK
eukprot:Blabericola_migrator_1__5915@NODE_2993_length_2133_cov_4_566312_g1872_i0_p4_GENE_NODE_2993_length_2133_cov_4_566312_g1872_i0NODE_2993_length_2133_cov_4_566312_g1872_i0_p4_ORF_typecomplete_len132_score0_06DUF429/PF04250_13/0_11_NODE_2993_length_2133_cov_4_566312_g1872_i014141809